MPAIFSQIRRCKIMGTSRSHTSPASDSEPVSGWLEGLGLGIYAGTFADSGIDFEVLPELTDSDLRELGLPLGPRKKLLKAIAALSDHGSKIEPIAAATARPSEAERRQLTVLFCDLVGSTELSAQLDPEDMSAVIRAYQSCCTELVERWGGQVAKYMGDGVLAYFGWPQAHEDEAERSVRAGLAIIDAVAELETPAGAPLASRAGIATGLVMVGELIGEGAAKEQTVVGDTPNLAARLQALAEPGTVVISQATRNLVGGLFELADLGPRRLKGFAEPLAVWRVEGEGLAEGRFEALHGEHLTPLVGREHELGILLERWAWAKDGDGQVVLLSGEPGIGKSRVTRTLRERLGDQPYTPLSHFCSPYHTNSALHPVIGLLERAARFDRDDAPDVQLAKLEAVLVRSSERLDEVVPLLAALLGVPTGERYPALSLTPEMQKRRTLQALVDQLAGLAAQQPVLGLYEDVHWIDPSMLELLGLVIERIRELPVLVLITFRPEFQPPWTGQAHVTTLTMSRLGRRQGADLVARVTGDKPLPAAIVEQIVARTDGVPLFVEELTKTVLESDLLTDAGDHYELSGSLPPVAIPTTLHDSLMARLDRLAPFKEVAQTAAVIGREFSHALLAAVSLLPEDGLNDALDQLVASELVFRRGAPPDATYTFKHALVQDAAYHSLLKSKRQQLHARIVPVLEDRFADTVETQPELLAHHCEQAGLAEKAIDYWHRAGQRASKRSANLEAIAHLTKGLDLARALPDPLESTHQELKLLIALGVPLVAATGYGAPEVGGTYTRALELANKVGETPHRFPAMWGLWHFHYAQGAFHTARDLGDELLSLAERHDNPEELLAAHQALGQSLYRLGEFGRALLNLEQARARLDPRFDTPLHLAYAIAPRVQCLAILAQVLWYLGYPDQALQRSKEAEHSAGDPPDLHSLTYAMFYAVRVHLLRGEARCADDLAEVALDQSTKYDFKLLTALIVFQQGWSLCQQSRGAEGVARMRTGLAAAEATDSKMMYPAFCALLGQAYGEVGQLNEARRMLQKSQEAVVESGQRHHEAETYRIKGELHMREARPEVNKAEACFQRALDIARDQQAKSWELRAATSLAQLWRDQGKRSEARDLLAPIYGWFNEGFDTADLKDAKALLDELA